MYMYSKNNPTFFSAVLGCFVFLTRAVKKYVKYKFQERYKYTLQASIFRQTIGIIYAVPTYSSQVAADQKVPEIGMFNKICDWWLFSAKNCSIRSRIDTEKNVLHIGPC